MGHRKVTTEEWLVRFEKTHGKTYDYSLIGEIKDSTTEIPIICKKHGVFHKSPTKHHIGRGCRECGIIRSRDGKRKSLDFFLRESERVHGDKYDYRLIVDFKGVCSIVDIICPIHDKFPQEARLHLKGHGCDECGTIEAAKKRLKTTQQFVEESEHVHGRFFDYSLVNYQGLYIPVDIICPIHDEFPQKPSDHLAGCGCKKCGYDAVSKSRRESPNGWNYSIWEKAGKKSNNFVAFQLYIIRCWNEDETFFKVGKTYRDIKKRFSGNKDMPYNYEVVTIIEGTAKEISEFEHMIQRNLKDFKYLPQIEYNGMYECFKYHS